MLILLSFISNRLLEMVVNEGRGYLCTWQCCPSVRGTWWTSASLQEWCPLAVVVDTGDCFQPPANGAETIKQEIEDNSTCKSTTKSSLIFCISPCYQESPTSWIIHFSVDFTQVILCKSQHQWSVSKVYNLNHWFLCWAQKHLGNV